VGKTSGQSLNAAMSKKKVSRGSSDRAEKPDKEERGRSISGFFIKPGYVRAISLNGIKKKKKKKKGEQQFSDDRVKRQCGLKKERTKSSTVGT